jgi:hypothetical protein
VNEKGEVVLETGLTDPLPFSVIVTLVALPLKVLLLTVSAVVPQTLPLYALNVTIGGLTHPQLTEKFVPVAVQPELLRTVI